MDQPTTAQSSQRNTTIIMWAAILAFSLLPRVIIQEFNLGSIAWIDWMKLGLMVVGFVGGWFFSVLRPLRWFFLIFFVLTVSQMTTTWIYQFPQWQLWFPRNDFITNMFGEQILRVGVALLVAVVLLMITHSWQKSYLAPGDIKALAQPIRWILDKPISWIKLGPILAVCITGGTLLFLVLAGTPSPGQLAGALPLLPAVLGLALMNSFAEEVSFRASGLTTLSSAVSDKQALLATAVYFGIAHYYGVPYGIIGVVMATILGWLLGKSMLETRGLFWAWFIHFLQDVAIFSFMAIGSIVAGGK